MQKKLCLSRKKSQVQGKSNARSLTGLDLYTLMYLIYHWACVARLVSGSMTDRGEEYTDGKEAEKNFCNIYN